jgi:phosphoribosylanthranilate isomerase
MTLPSLLPLVPRVKVCCISSLEEARLAIEHGASALGLVSQMPSGPGVIAEELIAEIAARVPPPVATFLLTCRREADAIVAQHAVCATSTIQLVDAVEPAQLQRLRRALPHIKLVQVIHVVGPASLDEALTAAPHVDALLLDSGNPALPVKELGGTGRVHDWQVSRLIRDRAPVPVFLAGGLRASNVREAIEAVQPFGVDLCSGVRTHGRLCAQKLASFMRAVSGSA